MCGGGGDDGDGVVIQGHEGPRQKGRKEHIRTSAEMGI